MAEPTVSRDPARFEFRVWSDRLDDAIGRMRSASEHAELANGAETYLLSRRTLSVNPKVRDRLLDVKVLVEEVDGFQRWDVHSKRGFPLDAAAVAELIGLLEAGPGDLARESYTLEELIDEVVDPHPALVAVGVTKQRELHTIGGCRGEITGVTLNGVTAQTVAIESPDLPELTALRTSLALASLPNTSYPSAILRMLDNRTVDHGN